MDKQELRLKIKELRKNLDMESISRKLCRKLMQTEEYKQAKNIMIFYPMKNEVNLLELLGDNSKQFYLPKIDGENLLCCPYNSGDKLCRSCFNTNEPLTPPVDKNIIDLIVIPALCCDRKNYRLGYGGGFYDRFLKNYKGIKLICIPKNLIVDNIFPEIHDIPADVIVTE